MEACRLQCAHVSFSLRRLKSKIALVDEKADGGDVARLAVLPATLRLLPRILALMARQRTFVLYPESSVLTTTLAAEVLGVSRPFLIRVLEAREIPGLMMRLNRFTVALTRELFPNLPREVLLTLALTNSQRSLPVRDVSAAQHGSDQLVNSRFARTFRRSRSAQSTH